MLENIISSHNSVICLNGESLNRWLIPWINKEATLIAADGAANRLIKLGMQPDYIIGDGDSYIRDDVCSNSKIIRIGDQNSTDFEKCIEFAKEKDLLPGLIFGFSGGEIDHVLGNTQTLLKHGKKQSLYFLDSYTKSDTEMGVKIGFPLSNERFCSKVTLGATVSILPSVFSRITSKGLVWELDHQVLEPDGTLGIRNRTQDDFIEIYVEEGKVLVIIDVT